VLVRLLVALAAGAAVGLSWQPYDVWPLLVVGLPAFTLAVRGARPRRAFALGYAFGLTLLVLAISWIHVLGIFVAVALIAFEALFFGLLGVALSLVSHLRVWPLAAACCWVLVEFTYARIPFGGFGWTRIAYAAVDTPLAGFFPVLGVVGVSFLVALIGQLVAWIVVVSTRRSLTLALTVTLAIVGIGWGLRSFQVEPLAGRAGSVNVGIVQGNSGHGSGTLRHRQPPQRDRQPDGKVETWPDRTARLLVVAGKLDRHRPAPGLRHPSGRAGRRPDCRRPHPRRCGDRGARAGRAADLGPVVGPPGRRVGTLRQAKPGAVRGVDPLPSPAAAVGASAQGRGRAVGARDEAGGAKCAGRRSYGEGRRCHLLRAGLRLHRL